ncbi:MAG: Exonuclease SbcD [Candidatus Rifleibacterium amylolyticum]|nr:MAG: Exonuclease SbcD [Candidatus Rifleibacterium amylolyticum]NLF98327.1 exonuclease subunit SbcD [Candidatus Riflebacteria bacterium]
MRILHTSDWHLGRSLMLLKRQDELAAFFDWLLKTIEERNVDGLIVAGDIFDNTTPPTAAQELYYNFLGRAARTCCNNIVIVAGNHDSPSLLDAPAKILKAINVHVVGTPGKSPENEVIILQNRAGEAKGLVCAVPYLRDRDIRRVVPGETVEDKAAALIAGIKQHYANICESAENLRQQLGDLPLLATGHLFTAGGQTVEGDGVRELYVGTIAHVGSEIFPNNIDYVALGHLHAPQKVGGHEHIRYSGSPIAMNFCEAKQQKKVILIEFTGRKPQIEEIAVPCFQPLEKICGDLAKLTDRIGQLVEENSNAWLEIEYTGEMIVPNLDEQINAAIADSELKVTRIINRNSSPLRLTGDDTPQSLEGMSEEDVFDYCLKARDVPEEQHSELKQAYREIVNAIVESDANKE